MLQDVETLSDATHEHPLALLAEQTKKHLQKDKTMYMPILKQRHHNAAAVSASLVHKLYGVKLVSWLLIHLWFWIVCGNFSYIRLVPMWIFQKPFLDSAEHLSEDIVAVFPAADSLEQYIIEIIVQTCEEGAADAYCRKLNLYKVRNFVPCLSFTLTCKHARKFLFSLGWWYLTCFVPFMFFKRVIIELLSSNSFGSDWTWAAEWWQLVDTTFPFLGFSFIRLDLY